MEMVMLAIDPTAQPQLHARDFVRVLQERGYRFFAGVPCSYFKHAIEELSTDPRLSYVGAVNEGAALGLCAGATIAGTKSACLLQNSGFGNLVNPLTSLSVPYRIPTLLFISLRAYPDSTKDEPQHRLMGERLTDLLDALEVPFWTVPRDSAAFAEVLEQADDKISAGGVAAMLIEKRTLCGEKKLAPASKRPLSRTESIGIIAQELPKNAIVISSTGMISRELLAAADRSQNFYMQGSMGHAMSMGLGIALAAPDSRVVVIDGDGSVLMHMGGMATIAECVPRHLTHIVIDNEAYGTTGNQSTASSVARLDLVADACGYVRAALCDDATSLRGLMRELCAIEGPTCLVVKVNRHEADNIPRITTQYSPEQTTLRVQTAQSNPIKEG
jgi:phosphonopyruvate decarboxylase